LLRRRLVGCLGTATPAPLRSACWRVCVRARSRRQGLPVRESLQVMYKINRDKTVLEGLLFMLWCLVYFFVVMAVNEVDLIYSSNAAIYNLLLDEEIPEYGARPTVVAGSQTFSPHIHPSCRALPPLSRSAGGSTARGPTAAAHVGLWAVLVQPTVQEDVF